MKQRTPLRRRTPLPRPSRPIKRGPVKRVNRARKASSFARAYGSKERVAFVKSLPCVNCSVVGFSQNAHGKHEKRGRGQKASYKAIIPLCGPWSAGFYSYEGCHAKYDRYELPHLTEGRVAALSAEVEMQWQEHLRRAS